MKRIRFPSPAMVVAMLALLVALSGTAVAAGIVPKAKVALNALKLQGKTAAQVAALAPAPASVGGLVTIKTAPWALAGGQGTDLSVACDSGQKAIGGGYDNPVGFALSVDTRPSSDDASWRIFLANTSGSEGASGTLYAICMK
jgi:hypothetical protein